MNAPANHRSSPAIVPHPDLHEGLSDCLDKGHDPVRRDDGEPAVFELEFEKKLSTGQPMKGRLLMCQSCGLAYWEPVAPKPLPKLRGRRGRGFGRG